MGLPLVIENTPAMGALNERQRAFVRALVELGGADYTAAARAAGYSDGGESGKTLHVTASRLAHDPKVLAAIREQAELRIHAGVLLGASVLIEIARDPLHKDRYKAADRLMERGGMLVATQHHVIVDDKRQTKELFEEVKALALRINIDPKMLLGKDAGIVDAEFTEVVGSDEGLEDLL